MPHIARMKYNLYTNLVELYKACDTCDTIDAFILDYIYWYCTSTSDRIDEKRKVTREGNWTWVNYNQLLNDMPLLQITSTQAISKRIKKLIKVGFFKTRHINGDKTYFQPTEKLLNLYSARVKFSQ